MFQRLDPLWNRRLATYCYDVTKSIRYISRRDDPFKITYNIYLLSDVFFVGFFFVAMSTLQIVMWYNKKCFRGFWSSTLKHSPRDLSLRVSAIWFISHLGWLVILSKWNLHLFLDPTLSRIIFFLSQWVLFRSRRDIIKMFQRLVLSETDVAQLIVTTSLRSLSILGWSFQSTIF